MTPWRKGSFARALAAPAPTNKDEDFKYVNFRLMDLSQVRPVHLADCRQCQRRTANFTDNQRRYDHQSAREISNPQQRRQGSRKQLLRIIRRRCNDDAGRVVDLSRVLHGAFPAPQVCASGTCVLEPGCIPACLQRQHPADATTGVHAYQRHQDDDVRVGIGDT